MKNFKIALKNFTDSFPFQIFITSIIALNLVIFGLETIPSFSESTCYALNILDHVCLYIFIVELILKIIGNGKEFFKSKWNIFDFIVIVISLVPAISFVSLFRSFRLLRLARTAKIAKTLNISRSMRLISSLTSLRKICRAIVISLPGVLWTFILLLIIYYLYAICGINLFGDSYPEYFGDLNKTFFTLFELMTFENWSNIARTVMSKYPIARIYFISFLIISSYMILNLVVGIVVDSISEASKEEKTERGPSDSDDLKTELNKLKEQISKIEKLIEQ